MKEHILCMVTILNKRYLFQSYTCPLK